MYGNECFALIGAMGWMGWLMPLSVMLLFGLGIAALVKYLFISRRIQEDHS